MWWPWTLINVQCSSSIRHVTEWAAQEQNYSTATFWFSAALQGLTKTFLKLGEWTLFPKSQQHPQAVRTASCEIRMEPAFDNLPKSQTRLWLTPNCARWGPPINCLTRTLDSLTQAPSCCPEPSFIQLFSVTTSLNRWPKLICLHQTDWQTLSLTLHFHWWQTGQDLKHLLTTHCN